MAAPLSDTERHLLTELEGSDASRVAVVLRTLSDSSEHAAFLDKLSSRISEHDKEIQRMCNHHYHGFIDSIQSLLTVREEADNLKSRVTAIDGRLQVSAAALQKKSGELVAARRTQANICLAAQTLADCLPVLATYSRLMQQIQDKRYYPALKTLEALEHTWLPRTHAHKFAAQMRAAVPGVRAAVGEAAMREIRHFLEDARARQPMIGQVSMKQQAAQQRLLQSDAFAASAQDTAVNFHLKSSAAPVPQPRKSLNSKKKLIPATNPFNDDDDTTNADRNPFGDADETDFKNPFASAKKKDDMETKIPFEPQDAKASPDLPPTPHDEAELGPEDLVPFGPVLRCLHIHTVLGRRDAFAGYYREQRQEQARLVMAPPPNMHESAAQFAAYLHGVAGFFVLEERLSAVAGVLVEPERLSAVASVLVEPERLSALWASVSAKVTNNIRNLTSYITDTDLLLEVKKLLLLFARTLESIGFSCSCVDELLLEIKEHYNEVLMSKWLLVFQEIFDEDNYHPITVQNLEEYNEITRVFAFHDPELEAEPFPKQFPFSLMVPKVFAQVKNYIVACLQFSQHLPPSPSLEDSLRRSTNLLLTRTLSGCLAGLIQKPGLGLLQLIQVTINTLHLEQANALLESYLVSLTGGESGGASHYSAASLADLQARAMFKDIRGEAEEQIYAALLRKLDEFLELASYDWLASEPQGRSSPFIADVIAFLRSTFCAFTNLPTRVAGTACMSACQHLARQLLAMLLSDSVRQVSVAALEQLSLDVLQCEQFAAGEPVPGLEEGALVLCFADARQLLDVCLAEDWSTYFSERGRGGARYLRVTPQRAEAVLEKLLEGERKGVFSRLKRNDKKRLWETVLKQLRAQ